MVKNFICAVVAVALVAFASVASAATWSIGNNRAPVVYATESITSGDVVIREPIRTTITASVALTDEETAMIELGDTFEVTFTLVNAKFARAVRLSEARVAIRATTNCLLRARGVESEAGGDSATVAVETVDTDCAVATPGMVRAQVYLTLPPLTGLTNTKAVTMKISADAPGGSGWPSLSADQNITTADPIVRFRDALSLNTLILPRNFESRIDLTAGRTGFVFPGQVQLASVNVGRRGAELCTERTAPYALSVSACTRQPDGTPFSLKKGGDGYGHLHVTTRGDFREDDTVFLDIDGDNEPDSGEHLDMHEDGSMRQSFRLDYVAGDPDAAAGEAGEFDREQGTVVRNLIYRPNGEDALRPGEYRTSVSATTSSATVADKVEAADCPRCTAVHTTSYTLVEDQRIAYAIPAPGTNESARVRIKCETATPCRLWLECDAPDGMSYFTQVEEPVPSRATLALSPEALSDALGIPEGGWESGRMSCYVYSTRTISVQQLTRSGGVLSNNTYADDND